MPGILGGPSKKPKEAKCPVCEKARNACDCPWDKPFEHWPRALLNTVQALVHDAPREK